MAYLGIDIGGSAIKGALVDLKKGELSTPRIRIETPEDNNPKNIANIIHTIVANFKYEGPVGCGFPAVVKNGIVLSAANIHPDWIDINAAKMFRKKTGNQFYIANDADVAGLAEMKFGAGKKVQEGVVLIITLGTGIGTAIFSDGYLLPNTEFGHIKIRGKDAEKRASGAAKKNGKLSWAKWTDRLQEFLNEMEVLFSPDLIIVGGGVSKSSDKFLPLVKLNAKIVPAELLNEAGIIGAALYASQMSHK
ncbi:MAG: ROK family protein [Anaerolineaceae bacterium]|nr:ROK family protein [Anaerolineaceae bacterium]